MRVVQLKRGRILKFASIALVLLGLFAFIAHKNGHLEGLRLRSEPVRKPQRHSDPRGHNVVGDDQVRVGGDDASGSGHVFGQSYPDELPKFLGRGTPGNFEPPTSVKVTSLTDPGQNGKGHHLRVEQKVEEERLKGVYGFNQLVSDEITLNRTVPDLREEECQFWDYPTALPKASVILVFHNEGWSTLLRTVNSIINRSPPQFLEEVLVRKQKNEANIF